MTSKELVKQVSAWYSSAEWRHVFQLVFASEYSSRLEGLNYMKMWKVRTPYLCGGIEGTLEVLEAVLYDQNPDTNDMNTNEKLKQTIYSMAIMRFLNLITDSTKYNSLYHTAQNLQIPQWIINIRHAVAHSKELPSLDLLREASQYALKWLYELYWKLENQEMVDCILNEASDTVEESNYKDYLQRFMLIYDNIVLYISEYRYKRVCDINIQQLKDEFVADVDNLLMHPHTYVTDRCYLKSLLFLVIKRINYLMKKFKENDKFIEVYVDSLLNCDHFLHRNISSKINPSYKEYVKFWTPLLDHLYVINGLPHLVKKLMVLSGSDKSEKATVASIWLQYILNGLAKCKSVQKITQTNYSNPPTIKRAIVEAIASTPEIDSPVMFRPELTIDPFFTGMDALKYALLDNGGIPNGKYWKILLMLMDEEFPAEDVATLDSLQNLINKNIDEESMDTEKTIFTVDDLMKVRLQHEVQNERTDDEAVTLNGIDKQDPQTSNPDVIWRETDDNPEWETISLGVIPNCLQTP